MNGVEKDTFLSYDTDAKLLTLYEYAHNTWHEIKTLKRWKPINAGVNFFGGIIGGAAAVFVYLKFLK